MLLEGEPSRETVLDHLCVEVESTEEVTAATGLLPALGLFIDVENDTTCCYAVRDKGWVHGPGKERWEVYIVKGDSTVCCTTSDQADPATASSVPGCG